MLHPPNYSKDFPLYIVTSTTTIGAVLVQEDSNDQEHVTSYLSKSIIDFETCYSHVEKLDFDTVIVVQRFLHYIVLRNTTVLAGQNPMYYILTSQVLGDKYSYWIAIMQEFDLDFAKTTSKKTVVSTKLMCDLPRAIMETEPNDSFSNEFLFLIIMNDPWYGDLIVYL